MSGLSVKKIISQCHTFRYTEYYIDTSTYRFQNGVRVPSLDPLLGRQRGFSGIGIREEVSMEDSLVLARGCQFNRLDDIRTEPHAPCHLAVHH